MIDDLNEAVVLGRKVLNLLSEEYHDWSASLINLTGYLSTQYK